MIARFFREIGRADELGSGVRNLFKYYHAFSDTPPELIEGDIFKIVVDVSKITPQVTPQVEGLIEGLNEELKQLLEVIKKNPGIQAKDIPLYLGNRSLKTIERQLKILKEKSLVERRGSRKTGGYYLQEN